MQHERHHWFRPPPHVNGWGWQTEQRLDELERQAQELPKHASAIARIDQCLSALSRWSLSDWVLANRRKLLLYGLVALMLTGNLVTLDSESLSDTGNWVQGLAGRLGEPVVRKAILQAMKIMGKQYVLGQTIDEGLARGVRSNPPGTRFSFDVLGEGARTDLDARRYFQAYSEAIDTIGRKSNSADICVADGISVKLSALHPRYHYSHQEQVMAFEGLSLQE